MATELQRAIWAYDRCSQLVGQSIPYVFGGGHGVAPVPKLGFPTTEGVRPRGVNGYDCSAAISVPIWYCGRLGSQTALSTQDFESWGQVGTGQHMTVRVQDIDNLVHHCFLVFTLPAPRTNRVFMASFTGGPPLKWYNELPSHWIEGYNARHMNAG